MPKTFTEQEKEVIKQTLIKKGREIFAAYGLKKTNVADLTKAAGIAQGTFYKFFDSKEALYFEILEQEHSGGEAFLTEILAATKSVKEALRLLIKASFDLMESNLFIRNLYQSHDYELLLRKLPRETLERHQASDADLALHFITRMQEAGQMIEVRPELIAGLFRALIFLSFHREEIGPDIYPEVINLLASLVADGLVREQQKP